MDETESIINGMVADMKEEIELSEVLCSVGKNLFRTQFEQAFAWEPDPTHYWAVLESAWRKATGGKPVPGKYRSNKSVILKAHGKSPRIEEWTEDHGLGKVMGKTAIQNAFSGGHLLTKEGGMRKILMTIEKVEVDSGSVEATLMVEELVTLLTDGLKEVSSE